MTPHYFLRCTALLCLSLSCAVVFSQRADCDEKVSYSGLSQQLATSRSADLVRISQVRPRCGVTFHKRALKAETASFQQVRTALTSQDGSGTWLLLFREGDSGHSRVIRCVQDDTNQSLEKYVVECLRFIQRQQPIPPAVYFRHFWSSHWLVEKDACSALTSHSYSEFTQMAAQFSASEIACELRKQDHLSPRQTRLGILLLAHSQGKPDTKVPLLKKLMSESLKGELPGQAVNLDAILCALLICDQAEGKKQILEILNSAEHSWEIRQKTFQAVSFGVSRHLLSSSEILPVLDKQRENFADIYPEILTLSRTLDFIWEPCEVIQMLNSPHNVEQPLEESACRLAVVKYYWAQNEAWRTAFTQELDGLQSQQIMKFHKLQDVVRTLPPVKVIAPEEALLHACHEATCVLGMMIED